MMKSILTLLISSFSLSHAVVFEAAPVFNLEKRALYAAGGWGLITTSSSLCPAGTEGHADSDLTICCPTGFESPDSLGPGARICCPTGSQCLTSFQAIPFCADSSWYLFNQTTVDSSFFCCLAGEQGTQDPGCVSGSTNVAATLAAISIGQPVPTGNAAVTISVSVGVGASTTGTVTTTQTGTVTTSTKGGGLLSSIINIATSHSDSRRIEPRAFNMPSIGYLGYGVTALAFAGLLMLFIGA